MPLRLGAVWRSVPSAPFDSTPLSQSDSACPPSTDSVWPSRPPGCFPAHIGQTTLTYPVFRIWWDATRTSSLRLDHDPRTMTEIPFNLLLHAAGGTHPSRGIGDLAGCIQHTRRNG